MSKLGRSEVFGMIMGNRKRAVLTVLFAFMLVLVACGPRSSYPFITTPLSSPSPTPTLEATPSPTPSSTPAPTLSPAPTPVPAPNLHLGVSLVEHGSLYLGTEYQNQRKLFRASSGTLVAVYKRGGGEDRAGLVTRYSRDNGQSWHDGFKLVSRTTYCASGVMDENNNIYLVYGSDAIIHYADSIHFRKLTYDSGRDDWELGPEHLIHYDSPDTGYAIPVIARIGSRLWVACRYYDSSRYGIVVSFADPDANGDYPEYNWSPWQALSPIEHGSEIPVVLVAYGSKLAALYSTHADQDVQFVKWRHLDNPMLAPTEWSPEEVVVPLREQLYGRLSAVADDAGNIHVVHSYPNYDIVYVRYEGKEWSKSQRLSHLESDNPTIATNGTDVWVFWENDLGIDLNRITYRKWTPENGWDRQPSLIAESFNRYFDAVWVYSSTNDMYIDETRHAATQDAKDVEMFAAPGDMLYMGLSEKFPSIRFTVRDGGALDNPEPEWEYWNGTAWAPLTLTANADYSFMAGDDEGKVRFNPPVDWEATTVNGYTGYYVRVKRIRALPMSPVLLGQVSPVSNTKVPSAIASDPEMICLISVDGSQFGNDHDVIFAALLASPTIIPTGKPSPPTGLAATSGQDSEVSLTWKANTEIDVTGYKLYKSTKSGRDYSLAAQIGRTTSYVDTGLDNDVAYYYVLTACDVSGNESGYSYEASAIPEVDKVPPEILGPSVSDITNYSAVISWYTNEPAISQVEYDAHTEIDTDLTTSHSVTLLGLVPETTYRCRVSSRDIRGNLATSGIFTLTTASSEISLTRYPNVQNCVVDAVTIAWHTDKYGDSVVEYGSTPRYGSVALDEMWTREHAIRISGLSPGMTYYYRILSNGVVLAEGETFHTNNDETDTSFEFVALGDSGVGSQEQYDIAERIEAINPDFAIHVGDVSQYFGEARDYDRYYFDVYRNTTSKICIYPCLGNHDVMTNNGVPFLEAFYLPHNNPAMTERYYSFDYGNAHFVALDTNIDFTQGSYQWEWLKTDLSSNDKLWNFVFFHHPAYNCGLRYGDNLWVQTSLCPLFAHYGVDLVFSGHDTIYHRSVPINGVVYIVTGGGGDHLGQFSPNNLTAYAESTHHVTSVSIDGNVLTLEAVNADGETIDSMVIQKH